MRLTPVGASSQTSGSAAGAVTAWSEPRFLLTSHTIPSCSSTAARSPKTAWQWVPETIRAFFGRS